MKLFLCDMKVSHSNFAASKHLNSYCNLMKYIKLVVIFVVLSFFAPPVHAVVINGCVVDENMQQLPYATVRVKNKKLATLCDSVGKFSLQGERLTASDTLQVSYLGYIMHEIPLCEMSENQELIVELASSPVNLKEIVVKPSKLKKLKKGKKHSWGLMTLFLDGQTMGECFGYEIHAKKGETLALSTIGFYYREGENQMTSMKFRINIYDMSTVKKSPSKDFKNILSKPIYFDCQITDSSAGKFEYSLSNPVVLPKDAMIEIEFLENLNDTKFWFKGNLLGKKTWNKSLIDGQWEKNPFATPFFIECLELDE